MHWGAATASAPVRVLASMSLVSNAEKRRIFNQGENRHRMHVGVVVYRFKTGQTTGGVSVHSFKNVEPTCHHGVPGKPDHNSLRSRKRHLAGPSRPAILSVVSGRD